MDKEFKVLVIGFGHAYTQSDLEVLLNKGWLVQSITPFRTEVLVILEKSKIIENFAS